METSLHRQLKELYATDGTAPEVPVAGYRIDAVAGGELIEIQQASLGALRDKTRSLLERHRVTIVKPLAHRKRIVQCASGEGIPSAGRLSPKHETWLHLFDDLVHFVEIFPHRRLTLEVVLTEQVELRTPRRSRRRFGRNYRVKDRHLTAIIDRKSLRTTADLVALLPAGLPPVFTTADIAQLAGIPRWLAQKMAYCLRKTGAVAAAGKQRNALAYTLPKRSSRRRVA